MVDGDVFMDDWKSKSIARINSGSSALATRFNASKGDVRAFLEQQAQSVYDVAGNKTEGIASLISGQASAVSDRLEFWLAGGSSTFKVISGDFRSGRAIIAMDGLKLRNRGDAVELVAFQAIRSLQRLQTEKRGSTVERVKGAAFGGALGGTVGTVAAMLALTASGPAGLLVGGAIGALLSVKHKYHTCRIDLRDGRSMVAVAANTNWLALAASLPARGAPAPGLGRLLNRK
jgi:outer membrane lipoprotein SlyB